MTPTRQTFAGLSHLEVVIWYGLIVISTAIFVWGAAILIRKYVQGRRENIVPALWPRAGRMLVAVAAQSPMRRRDRTAGIAHALVFYGFLVLFAGTSILAVQTDITKPAFDWTFWEGGFYLGYKLCLDAGGLALLAGLCLIGWRRGVSRPPRLDYRRPDRAPGEYDRGSYVAGDWAFLITLFFLVLTGFVLEGLDLARAPSSAAAWSPAGWVLAKAFTAGGAGGGQAYQLAHHVLWWVHGVVALGFVSSIPFTKAVHMLASPATLAVRDPRAGVELPGLDAGADGGEVGYARITDLSWRHLLSLDGCTKCGKCHEACPATASGYPLSPRDLILDLREVSEGAGGIRAALGVGPPVPAGAPVLGDPIRAQTLWSCMQCMACVEICPVGIEHVPIINQMRRQLVERGELEPSLQQALEAVYTFGNSFGEPARKRPRWARSLGFEITDIRKAPAELLWFVGDYASFDPRNQQATRALAAVLHQCGVDFGILYDAEKTGGCDVRRAGEEELYATLAQANVATISGCQFERIFSSDPHTFHTLKNEYPAFGGDWTVLHHSELLLELIESGRLRPLRQLGYRVTYHDPCTLGRYNRVFDAPRRVLAALGVELVEMPRNRDNSFCCGAGGGRIWMTDPPGARRPSEQRIEEAMSLGSLDFFVVACPKDVTMYEDAIKTTGHQADIALRELSELVYEAVQPAPATTAPSPTQA
jgi:Fe-S oxidoreductase/nitrate reductase gamma subunit